MAFVESGFDPNAVGGVGEIGLMQIRPSTAEMLGHSGGALALFDPETNARFAVRYLATAWKLANGDLCRALMKYRAGHGAEVISPLSAQYCLRAKAYLARLGSPLAGRRRAGHRGDPRPARRKVDVGGLAADEVSRPLSRLAARQAHGARQPRFWAAHEARIRALEAKIERRIERRTKLRVARRG